MKNSTFQNCCTAIQKQGYMIATISEVAKAARVSKSTAHRFFAICESSRNIFVEDENGRFRRVYAVRNGIGEKLIFRGLFIITDYPSGVDSVIIRRGES